MNKLAVLLLAGFLLCVSAGALAQKNMSPPAASVDPETKTGQNQPLAQKRNLVEVQQEADVLARAAQAIPSERSTTAKPRCRTMSSRN